MSLQLLTNNDKLVKPYEPTDNTHKTTQLHFKKFIILMLFNWYFLHHQKRYIPHLKMKTVWNKDVSFRMVITLPLNFKWKLFPCEFSKLFLVVFKRWGTSDMKKIFFSFFFSIHSPVLSSSFLFFQTINKKDPSVRCSPITYPVTDFKTNTLQ